MNYLKRVLINIGRSFGKGLLLFFVVFILGNIIASSISIYQVVFKLEKQMSSKLGSLVSISLNEEGRNIYNSYENSNDLGLELYENELRLIDNYYKIIDNERIVYSELQKTLNYYNNQELITLFGVENSTFTDLELENIFIVNGRTFSNEEIENGEKVIIVDQMLASNYNLGDKMSFTTVIDDNEYKTSFEIIGFYSKLKNNNSTNFRVENTDFMENYYVPKTVLDNEFKNRELMNISYDDELGKYHIYSIIVKLDTPKDIRTFCNTIEQEHFVNKDFNTIQVLSFSNPYEVVSGPLEILKLIAIVVFGLSIIVSIIILSLVVIMFLKDRKQEIGIYLSLGERKWRIITQIVLEVYLIGLIAITFSIFSGNYLGNIIASEVLNAQYEKQHEIIESKLDRLQAVNIDNIDSVVNAEDFNIIINNDYIIYIYLVGSFVLIVSSYVPIRKTLKVKPKEILM